MNEKAYKHAKDAFAELNSAYHKAEEALIAVIKECGGIIPLRPTMDKPTIHCFVDGTDFDCDYNRTESIPIQAIAYDEGEGLMVLTNYELRNYEYDNGCEFNYYYGNDEEDEVLFRDAIKDITYFRPLDDGYSIVRETIYSILSGLEFYLEEA